MTPEEELKRLNRLLAQYETVYRTTPDAVQRGRAERQIREMRSYREKLLAVLVVKDTEEQQTEEEDDLAEFPLLAGLRAANLALPFARAVPSFAAKDAPPTASQEEIYNLSLYVRRFEKEFLPFLSEKQLKLDFKFSMDRDAFYGALQAFQRRVVDYREENGRVSQGTGTRDMETETRKRAVKVARLVAVEGARFFRSLQRFADELVEDADGDGVKCLNGDHEIEFDTLEGERALQGLSVMEALTELGILAAEAVAYLNVPEIETQETRRADRH
jgi:hypothetical protein